MREVALKIPNAMHLAFINSLLDPKIADTPTTDLEVSIYRAIKRGVGVSKRKRMWAVVR